MEPLSIIASVVTIVTRVIPAAVQVYDAWDHYAEAPQSVADIVDELQIVRASLHQLQNTLGREDAKVTVSLGEVFAIAVNGCKATLLCIEEEYKNVVGCEGQWSRIKVLWKEGTMARLLEQLARKKTSIALLMQCLSLESTLDVRRTLQEHRSQLVHARSDLSDLSVSYPTLAAPIVEAIDRASVASIAGSGDTVLSDTEFSFDQELISTRIYRENMARLMRRDRRSKQEKYRTSSRSSDTSQELENGVDPFKSPSSIEDPFQSPSGIEEGQPASLIVNSSELNKGCTAKAWKTLREARERKERRDSYTRRNKPGGTEKKPKFSPRHSRGLSNDDISDGEKSPEVPIENQRIIGVQPRRNSDTSPSRCSETDSLFVNPSTSHLSHSSSSHGIKGSSVNNQKLLETVEDAIKRLILPETETTKIRRRTESASRDAERVHQKKSRDQDRSGNSARDAALTGLDTAAAALKHHDSQKSDQDKKERRQRKKNKSSRSRVPSISEIPEADVPPLPVFQSAIRGSALTRDAILSAGTETRERRSSRSAKISTNRDKRRSEVEDLLQGNDDEVAKQDQNVKAGATIFNNGKIPKDQTAYSIATNGTPASIDLGAKNKHRVRKVSRRSNTTTPTTPLTLIRDGSLGEGQPALPTEGMTSGDKMSYSIPDDGTPVPINLGRKNAAQTSLLIEYFEGTKGRHGEWKSKDRPSVRVRVTPSGIKKGERKEPLTPIDIEV